MEATQIFTFQNDRGIDPTDLEKLKAFLMHRVYVHSANHSAEEAITDIEHLFAAIDELTERIDLREDRVLSYHSIAFLREGHPALENIRAEVMKEESDKAKVKWIKSFCHDLRGSFRHVEEIERRAKRDCLFADVLILDAPNSWPLLLKLFRFHKGEIGCSTMQRILQLMEITLFKKEYSLSGYRTNSFPGVAKAYQGKADALRQILEGCLKRASRITDHSTSGSKTCWMGITTTSS